MPIKSKAQRRKFAELLVKGEISPETFEKWNRGAGTAELPERVKPKAAKRTKKAKVKRGVTSMGGRAKKRGARSKKRR